MGAAGDICELPIDRWLQGPAVILLDVVFVTSRDARGFSSSFCDIWFSQHFISNLATTRAEGNGTQTGQVMGGAGESRR